VNSLRHHRQRTEWGRPFRRPSCLEGKLVSIEQTPEGIVAHLVSTDVNTPHISATITLSDREKGILFAEELEKRATTDDEAAYFAFPSR